MRVMTFLNVLVTFLNKLYVYKLLNFFHSTVMS